MPRAVLDANVLVSALVNRDGPCARLLVEGRAGAFELILSPRLIAELRDVIGRDKFRRYFSLEEGEAFIARVSSGANMRTDPAPSGMALASDPADEYLIDLARDAPVHALVTGDKALLELRDVIPVMTPAEFMATLADS